MIHLTKSLDAWNTPGFEQILRDEIQALDAGLLPLQEGLSQGSFACLDDINVIILRVLDEATSVRVKAGVFYSGLIPGCNCADDPSPIDEHTEYCELQFDIDKTTAETKVRLL